MAENGKKTEESGVITQLSKRGEDAVNRLMEELGRNARVTDALGAGHVRQGQGRREDAAHARARSALAAADEIKDLRGRLERLEKRLATLETREGGGLREVGDRAAKTTAAKKTAAKPRRKPSSARRSKPRSVEPDAKKSSRLDRSSSGSELGHAQADRVRHDVERDRRRSGLLAVERDRQGLGRLDRRPSRRAGCRSSGGGRARPR